MTQVGHCNAKNKVTATAPNKPKMTAFIKCFHISLIKPYPRSRANPPLPRESLRVVLQFKILKNTNIV